MIVEDHERDTTDTYQLPNGVTLVPPRLERYSEHEKRIRLVELQSAVQHRKLTNNLIDLNWARLGARNEVTE